MKCFLYLLLAICMVVPITGCTNDQQAIYDEYATKSSAVGSEAAEKSSTGELTIGVKLEASIGTDDVPIGIGLAAREFEAMHPGVKITFVCGIDTDDSNTEDGVMYRALESSYTQNRIVELMSGKAPDIISMSGISIPRYSESGLLCDLYSFGDFDEAFPEEEYFTNMLKGAGTDKGLFAIPVDVSPSCLWVNQEVAALADVDLQAIESINTQDILDLYRAAAEKGVLEEGFAVDDEMTQVTLLAGEYLDLVDVQAGQAHFETESFCALLEEIKAAPFVRTVEAGPLFTSSTGEVKQYDTTTRLVTSDSLNRTSLISYKTGALKAEPVPRSTLAGRRLYEGDMFAITQNSENKELAWEFLKFAVSFRNMDENGKALCTAGLYEKGMSLTKYEYYDDRYGSSYPLKRAFAQDYLESGMGKMYDEALGERVTSILEKADTLNEYDPLFYDALIPIYTDYFDHGLLTSEQCAQQLQEKADIYLQE